MSAFRIATPCFIFPLALLGQWQQEPPEPVPAIPYHPGPSKTEERHALPAKYPKIAAFSLPPQPVFSLPQLTTAERRKKIKPGSTAIGLTRDVPKDAMHSAQCTTLPGGTSVWRIAIHSPAATSLRLHFQDFDLRNSAAAAWLSSPDTPSQFHGPYVSRGTFEDGDFWSNTVAGDTAVLTLEHDLGCTTPPSFVISEVAHTWPAGESPSGERQAEAGACQQKFNCSPNDAAWQPLANSVAKISTISPTGEVNPNCTGTLIRTRSGQGQPYLLTAGHCIGSDWSIAGTMEFRWFNQLSSCTPAIEAPGRATLGARFLTGRDSYRGGDFALLTLVQPPPTGAIAAGWDPSVPPVGSSLVTIHHPSGSFKHISQGIKFGYDTEELPIYNSIGLISWRMPAGTYIRSLWHHGSTEGGSSGAPLFSSPNPGSIIGTLSAGMSCNSTQPISIYYRFASGYQDMKQFLEDCSYSVAGNNASAPPTGSVGSYSVTTNGYCRWVAKSSGNWINILEGSLSPLGTRSPGIERVITGSAQVQYNVLPNLGTLPRIGSISVAGQSFYIAQSANNPQPIFEDVPLTHLFSDYIHILTSKGIHASGCTAGQFCPDIPTTRSMMAEFIVRTLFGETFPFPQTPFFPDVPANHPSFRFIQKLRETSITIGCGDGVNFCPNDSVTREQMAAFIVRTIMVRNGQPALATFQFSPIPYFTDVPATSAFFSYIQKMKEIGITSGVTATTYGPAQWNSRGQIAVFLVRSTVAP